MARNSLKNVAKLIDAAKSSLPPEKDFIQDLKRSIEIDQTKEKRKPSKYYKPSGMNCIRAMYYTRLGKKQDDDGGSYVMWGICNSGTDTHERVQKAVANMQENDMDCEWIDVGEYVKQRGLKDIEVQYQSGMETKLKHKKLHLSFLCDGLIRYKNHYYILELKTESSRKWYNREGVDESHFMQATCYSTALGIDEVLFVYINRDIFDLKPFLFLVTDEMKMDLVGYIDTCEQHVKDLKVPKKPENIARKTCEYCAYKNQCRKDE